MYYNDDFEAASAEPRCGNQTKVIFNGLRDMLECDMVHYMSYFYVKCDNGKQPRKDSAEK